MMTVSETKERIHQGMLIKEHFDRKEKVLEARQAKFLRLYPYSGTRKGANLKVFEAAVKTASGIQKNEILDAYVRERDYWNSAYVINKCNRNIHAHIIATLEAMSDILLGTEYTYTSKQWQERKLGALDRHAAVNGNHWGRAGEEAVDYVLKWLPSMYHVIDKDCRNRYHDHIILLENPAFADEAQEFDHIVVGPQGIFLIETKNYAGKLCIDKAGNWIRLKNGDTEWTAEENPAQQIFRHHVLLRSIVGDEIPIIDVICLAHPKLMITGQENSSIPVVKKDLLADFIIGYQSGALTEDKVSELCGKINASKTNK